MERDEETGLQRHGSRYLSCWLGLWTSVDPAGLGRLNTRYNYCCGNPVRKFDRNGLDPGDAVDPHEAAVQAIYDRIFASSEPEWQGVTNIEARKWAEALASPDDPEAWGGLIAFEGAQDVSQARATRIALARSGEGNALVAQGRELEAVDSFTLAGAEYLASGLVGDSAVQTGVNTANFVALNELGGGLLAEGLRYAGEAAAPYARAAALSAFLRLSALSLEVGGSIDVEGIERTLVSVWKLAATVRGKVIENLLGSSEYSEYFRAGALEGGTFEKVDFQKGGNLVQLKTTATSGKQLRYGVQSIIRTLKAGGLPTVEDGVGGTFTLDVRVRPGVTAASQADIAKLQAYGRARGIDVVVSDYDAVVDYVWEQ